MPDPVRPPGGLDPELETLLRAQGGLATPDLAGLPLADALDLLRAAKPAQAPPPDETAETQDRLVPGRGGHLIPIRLYRPPGPGPYGAMIHLHGGGWVGGSIGNDEIRSHVTACRSGRMIISVDYRLAPEHRFPAGLEDAYDVLVWVAAEAEALGIDRRRIGIGGASAGGNLAAAAALLARERGGPAIALQLMTYPICDTSLDFPSYRENAAGPLLSAAMMAWFVRTYLPPDADPADPLVAPLRLADCRGLPPALIITAELDPLRDEAEAYAARLAEAGVDVTCRRYDGVVHGFITRAPGLPQSRAALDQIVGALATRL
jgi:acetyl esterase